MSVELKNNPQSIRRGSLKTKSLPRLLCELWQEKVTGALKLNKRLVEKTLYLRKGKLIQADSNILHDTLTNFLVKQAVITEAQAATILEKSAAANQRIGELLVAEKLVDATAVYKYMQQLLTAKVVDCFLWDDGNFEFIAETTPPIGQLELSIDPFHVLVQGVQTSMPFERMREDITLILNKPVRVTHAELPSWSEGYLNTTSLKLLKAFNEPKKPRYVMEELGISEEIMLRIVYIFDVTGLIINTETPLSAEKAAPVAAVASASAQAPQAVVDAERDGIANKALIDEVLALTLKLDKINHFELFGLDWDASPVAMSMAYLKMMEKFNLGQFRSGKLHEYRQQAENIVLAAAEAYADLRDIDSKVRYTDKLKAKRRDEENAGKKVAGAAFKIRTDLLDANSQFEEGVKHLEQRHYDNAIKYFEYAIDIDGRDGRFVAYLAWSLLQKRLASEPDDALKDKEVIELFEKAIKAAPENAKCNMLYGKYLLAKQDNKRGLFHLKKAATLAPADIEIQRALRLATSPA